MRNENGLTLADLIAIYQSGDLLPEQIFLLTADGQPIIELDIPSDTPDLWFLGDDAY